MNTELTENTPLIEAIEEKLESIDDELSVISAVEAAEGTSREINQRIEFLVKARTEYQQILTVEKQRSVFEDYGPTDSTVFN